MNDEDEEVEAGRNVNIPIFVRRLGEFDEVFLRKMSPRAALLWSLGGLSFELLLNKLEPSPRAKGSTDAGWPNRLLLSL